MGCSVSGGLLARLAALVVVMVVLLFCCLLFDLLEMHYGV